MPHRTVLTVEAPQPYRLSSVTDHGWVALRPCTWDAEAAILQRVEQLDSGQVVLLQIGEDEQSNLALQVESHEPLEANQASEIEAKIRRMLKLDEDLADFYKRAVGHPTLGAISETGRGRLLRSPTLFEDVIKTICTTNITWSQTKSMLARLVDTLGAPYPENPELRAFPTAQQVADADPELFDKSIRLGYRNQYVQELAQKIANGAFQLEALDNRAMDPVVLRKAFKKIKGVGDYAANTLMMIVGHYGHLAIDSEFRAHVAARYFAEVESVSDREMAAIYEDWGDWQYLAYWFDHDE